MKRILPFVSVIAVFAVVLLCLSRTRDQEVVQVPAATTRADGSSVFEPASIARLDETPTHASPSASGGPVESPSRDQPGNRRKHPEVAGFDRHFERASVDPMWGMNAEEVAAAQPSLQRAGERKARAYFDTIATGLLSTGLLEFDVTYRGLSGESTVSIINLDLRNQATRATYEDLLRALTETHGAGDQAINDQNRQYLLTRTTWTTENGSVALTHGEDFIGEDTVSIEYRKQSAEHD